MKGPKPRPLAERFWEKVRKGPGCWEWTANITVYGYGQLYVRECKRPFVAHVVSYALHHGLDLPLDLFVLHKCDNRRCVRPDHLFLGTLADNNKDMAAKGRASKGESHHWAKLKETEAQDILERLIRGENQDHVALLYGISSSMVYFIGRGRSWRHLRHVVAMKSSKVEVTITMQPDKGTSPVELGLLANKMVTDLFASAGKMAR